MPDTTIGVRWRRFCVRRTVAIGTIRFMKARVTTGCTSPIWPVISFSLTVRNRRRNRWV